jgi:hypothetical protein
MNQIDEVFDAPLRGMRAATVRVAPAPYASEEEPR